MGAGDVRGTPGARVSAVPGGAARLGRPARSVRGLRRDAPVGDARADRLPGLRPRARHLGRARVDVGRLAQRESASLTRKRSQVRILQRPRVAAGDGRSADPQVRIVIRTGTVPSGRGSRAWIGEAPPGDLQTGDPELFEVGDDLGYPMGTPDVRVDGGTRTVRYRMGLRPPRGEIMLSGRIPWTIEGHPPRSPRVRPLARTRGVAFRYRRVGRPAPRRIRFSSSRFISLGHGHGRSPFDEPSRQPDLPTIPPVMAT